MIFRGLGVARWSALGLAVELGGRGVVVFLDCGNGFDPYQVLKLAENRLEAVRILKRVFVSRPFTFYQLRELVYKDLEAAAKNHGTNEIVIFALTTLFLDDSRNEEEKIGVLNSIANKLKELEGKGLSIHYFLDENKYSTHFEEVLANGKNRTIIPASH